MNSARQFNIDARALLYPWTKEDESKFNEGYFQLKLVI